jgi:deazaflavin-dependent oxidoreductase (nitroreductase family)
VNRYGHGAGSVVRDMESIETALAEGGIIDIITTGRRTGKPRRTEIYLHNLDGVLYLTGRPGRPRDWVANISANPEMTIHLKRGIRADVPARGTVIRDPVTKASIVQKARVRSWGVTPEDAAADIDVWVNGSPLVRVEVD